MASAESGLIRRYFAELTPRRDDVVVGIGDDAAVLRVPDAHELVVSTDGLVAGVHFFPDADPAEVGYKTLAVNLSDMAAMGAEPRWATLVLTMPSADEGWIGQFADGFRDIAGQFGVALVGGDLGAGPLAAAVQIAGVVPAGTALRRDRAQAGDSVYVTGELGGAALALSLLKKGTPQVPAECLQRLHRPVPRVEAGLKLRGLARTAIDVSDGLFLDLARVAQASGVGAEIELARVPLAVPVGAVADLDERLGLGLGSGDDYELCFTAPAGAEPRVMAAMAEAGISATRIGRITGDGRLRWFLDDGSEYRPQRAGYEHF